MGEERSNRKTYVRIYTLFNSRLRAKVIPTRIPITACYADKIRLNPSIQFVHFTNPIYRYFYVLSLSSSSSPILYQYFTSSIFIDPNSRENIRVRRNEIYNNTSKLKTREKRDDTRAVL